MTHPEVYCQLGFRTAELGGHDRGRPRSIRCSELWERGFAEGIEAIDAVMFADPVWWPCSRPSGHDAGHADHFRFARHPPKIVTCAEPHFYDLPLRCFRSPLLVVCPHLFLTKVFVPDLETTGIDDAKFAGNTLLYRTLHYSYQQLMTEAPFERVAQRKLRQLDIATELRDLASPPGNHLEALKGDRKGQHSIRINEQWRLCFIWRDGDAYDVEIADYH
jgi:toxin HigB-1